MITDIIIEDYQSVRAAQLRLGKLTVVTGPTGSGKSAVIRAVKLAAHNARGTSYIRRGAKQCQVALGCQEEGWVVRIQRGGRGSDSYRVARFENSVAATECEDFTKLAGAVPEEVRALLRLGEINFAGQFDRPFLLAESGSQVARTLGELTNVTLVLDAAREASRRKQETARRLRSYEDIVRSLTVTAQRFRTLRVRREAAFEAREHLDRVEQIAVERARLGELWSSARIAVRSLGEADAVLDRLAAPSAEQLDSLQARAARLRSLYAQRQEADQAARNWQRAEEAAARDEEKAHQDLHRALVEAGTCPTCGREM